MTCTNHIHTADLSRPGAQTALLDELNRLGGEGWRLTSTQVVMGQRGESTGGQFGGVPGADVFYGEGEGVSDHIQPEDPANNLSLDELIAHADARSGWGPSPLTKLWRSAGRVLWEVTLRRMAEPLLVNKDEDR